MPTISEIERACLAAWPALETIQNGQWVARFAKGYSKRANSVQSLDLPDDTDAPERIEAMAQLYRERGLVPTFRVTPLAGPNIATALDGKGWDEFEHSLVLAMPLSRVARPVAALTQLFEVTDPQWQQAHDAMAGADPVTSATLGLILSEIAVPARGIVVYNDQRQPVGAALAVDADGIAIFLNVVVDPQTRGQGYGRALMHAALNWTGQSGAREAAIQVLADNSVALSLYRSLGFTEAYGYHYRRAPQ